MMAMLSRLINNIGSISKFLVSVIGPIGVGLSTHNWASVPAVLTDIGSALVYLIPNSHYTGTSSGSS